MIVGCYALALYCDVCWGDKSFPYERRREFPHEYTGPNLAKATKEARKEGWMVRHPRGDVAARCVCPDCKKEGHK